ncbi:hypothetical protein BVRB_4g083440 [Beta vulgaris subsp. vulgaris]|nr:hypothetical protein BVRB_4g083440 [Beta vulgaris subsp. vulgaris]
MILLKFLDMEEWFINTPNACYYLVVALVVNPLVTFSYC